MVDGKERHRIGVVDRQLFQRFEENFGRVQREFFVGAMRPVITSLPALAGSQSEYTRLSLRSVTRKLDCWSPCSRSQAKKVASARASIDFTSSARPPAKTSCAM